MVEQRPFKALVVGSSPTQPKFGIPAAISWEATNSAIPRTAEALENDIRMGPFVALCYAFSGLFRPVLLF
jgi:hypothetical protein